MKRKFLSLFLIILIISPISSYKSFSSGENLFDLVEVVNKDKMLTKDFVPENIENTTVNRKYNGIRVDNRMISDLSALFNEAKKQNITLTLNSGYRSYYVQSLLYNHSIRYRGWEYTNKYAAPSGASEHQTGLAVDISSTNKLWLVENAHKFGFDLRYKKGKEAITGFEYESWHFRYIGDTFISTYMYEKSIVLEEIETDETIFFYKIQNLD